MSTNATMRVQPTDNTLINGRNPFNCSLAAPGNQCTSNAPFSKFQVQAGKTYKLRLINSGAGSLLGFSIDNHDLTIISNDFVDLQPYNTTVVQLGVGASIPRSQAQANEFIRLVNDLMSYSRLRRTARSGCGPKPSENSVRALSILQPRPL